MFSNNEIGASSYMHEIGNVREENDWLFHTDCVQAAGHFAIDVVRAGCDFATISSHKIHGPKGVGALFIKDPGRWNPMVLGGTDQEFGLRGGTENVAGIVGFGRACEIAHAYMNSHEYCKMRLMKSAFSERLKQKLHSSGVADLIHSNGCLDCTKTMSFRVDGVDAESLILMADNAGVCISAGSACNSRENIPSHVLTAIGLNSQEARSSFRVSFSRMNTVDEARVAAEIIADCIVALLSTGCDG
jgi:cysteine desulfurase